MEKQNIYQKIQLVRAQLVELKLKKSGKNTYSNFTYYELSDFLPQLNKLNKEVGLMTKFSLYTKKEKELARMEVFNCDTPTEIVTFTIPTAEVEIGKKKDGTGGADPIQNLGGKITYLRRYLMMVAFEIIESDYVDKSKQDNQNPLDDESVNKINACTDYKELVRVCNEVKRAKGEKYKKSLLACYSAKKKELEGEKEVIQK